ncbi:MAG: 3-phosphoshikimate 1-carboxyvinyltransferase [Prevotellaceae bacterium]|jgi:3-phosphoshikimate 1-carboxyvinyltransferase|nr:3-phosphoshikimate 1-carboxyvinyltransferase [Prevotellaceae bacterium]
MNRTIAPKTVDLHLEIQLPASKSISNRALILNALSDNPHEIINLSDSDDTRLLQQALDSNDTHFDIGASGTAMRFLTAFLSKTFGEWTITGSERMNRRPIKILVDALNTLGAKITYLREDGFPPLRIFGSALTGGELRLDGSVSSQYISALMLIAPYMRHGLQIRLEGADIVSRPYIEMTAAMMRRFGVTPSFEEDIIHIPAQAYRPVPFTVESDWSAASYWYEILSIIGKGSIFFRGLTTDSIQGDSETARLFENFGIKTVGRKEGVFITAGCKTVTFFEYNFIAQPDLAQTFAVTCCAKAIPFRFTGLHNLRIKETDRIEALTTELRKLGYLLTQENSDSLIWTGAKTEPERNSRIETYNDHRMAMAFAPMSLLQTIEISHSEVVSKSYPHFWDDFDKINQSMSSSFRKEKEN